MNSNKKKFVIISGYFANETYGLLGPQMAATIIKENTSYDCIVVAVSNEYKKADLKKALNTYFAESESVDRSAEKPIVGFSTLGGRIDLFEFAKELKDEGTITILAGPQAGVDFKGEVEKNDFPHRFQGFADYFNFAIQGPAEQIIPFLNSDLDNFNSKCLNFNYPGFLYKDEAGTIISNPPAAFTSKHLSKVFWDNIFVLENSSFKPLKITSAQILQQIGCPHASVSKKISIDYPQFFSKDNNSPVKIEQKGCSFCDVATDKGYMGNIKDHAISEQLKLLPEKTNLKKIPFELINENPVPKLLTLLELADSLKIRLSQINLTMRADYFVNSFDKFKIVLEKAQKNKIKILVSSIGFESFDNTILKNLNKGVTAETNIKAVKKMRMLEYKFQNTFTYTRKDGANHGFIHPTPWDNAKTQHNTNTQVARYSLANDILPNHSTPLIIHHASALAEWARHIELEQRIKFSRHGSTIGWWQIDGKIIL
ncbi:MAG: hypothetical protein KAR45_05550 [Desulfobacteraceae bacterium]|nr:hypothetical protein [Desulfobacteraceae bacterium]